MFFGYYNVTLEKHINPGTIGFCPIFMIFFSWILLVIGTSSEISYLYLNTQSSFMFYPLIILYGFSYMKIFKYLLITLDRFKLFKLVSFGLEIRKRAFLGNVCMDIYPYSKENVSLRHKLCYYMFFCFIVLP